MTVDDTGLANILRQLQLVADSLSITGRFAEGGMVSAGIQCIRGLRTMLESHGVAVNAGPQPSAPAEEKKASDGNDADVP